MSGNHDLELWRDSSQSKFDALIRTILDEINAYMKRPENPEKSFICYEDLKRIWSDRSRIQTLLQLACPSEHQIRFIQEHMIMILSTLIFIGATDFSSEFLATLFNSNSGNAPITDDEIPFEMNQLIFLYSKPALQQNFYTHQFQFKPVVIEVTWHQKPQVIKNPKLRLPFEYLKKDIGSGGFGKVDVVGISPKYINEAGSIRENVHKVACKKIKFHKDFKQEVDNLQVLKESLTLHHRIMLHLTTIEHGSNCYILLPFAQRGDLELFLHCGVGPDGKKKYDFDVDFPEVRNGDITQLLLSQCWSLASALEWLHNGITIEGSSSTVKCVHMDLKPANILIQLDHDSAVGKWMISDFGISVLREEDPRFVSIGDYYSQLTMNLEPRRNRGTYQAPEVELSHLTQHQKGIGRRSDIWSYGCIFSEVLAFALGRDRFVYDFHDARRGPDGRNYFYIKDEHQGYLMSPDNMRHQYLVNPFALEWLNNLRNSTIWADFYVETIKKILVVDAAKRPEATELKELVNRVKEKVDCSQVGGSQLLSRDGVDVPRTPALIPPTPNLTDEINTMSRGAQSVLPASPEFFYDGIYKDRIIRPRDMSESTTSNSSSGIHSLLSTTSVRPPHAHGIMIDSDERRTPNQPICRVLSELKGSNLKAKFITLTYMGEMVRAAYLVKSSVYFYDLNLEDLSASLHDEVPLPPSDGWQGVAVADRFLAAWGYSSRQMLHFRDLRALDREIDIPSLQSIEMLERVVVSKHGIAALLCREEILVVNIGSENPRTLSAQAGQKFTDVAFNDTGDLLFAWAYGQKDSLYIWRYQDGVMSENLEFGASYKTSKIGKPYLTRVIPYNTYPGCIIAKPNKRFFVGQVRNSERRTREPQLPDHEVNIFDSKAMCMFCDHSMITVEKGFRKYLLKEYKIEHEGNHLRNVGEEICKLEESPNESSRLLAIKHNENIIVIICNLNAKVEFVKIVPAPPEARKSSSYKKEAQGAGVAK